MIDYSQGTGEFENWIVSETEFSSNDLRKCEAIMALGNGYMGIRSATEESYINEQRNCFINGTFNKAHPNEVTELPNVADTIHLNMYIDGARFSLEYGAVENYMRQLNLKTAELSRSFEWTSPRGKKLRFHFKRFASLENPHLMAMKLEVESLSHQVEFSIESGINAQLTNSGAQHFKEGEKRVLGKKFIQLVQTTSESNVDVVVNTTHHIRLNDELAKNEPDIDMARRKVWIGYDFILQPNDRLEVEKFTTIHTSRDLASQEAEYDLQQLRESALGDLKTHALRGYDSLFNEHKRAWQQKVWNVHDLKIDSSNTFDQLGVRFALYHLTAMAPTHDARLGIGAKGLSGEGYKGHSFWDTEVFILPFFIFSQPKAAKSLLMYRYLGLAGARAKARENGYEGAMYPWEMAWPADGEVTPLWGDIDIVTGEQSRIWSGAIEQHISADIAFSVYQYSEATNDQEFLDHCGYEIVFETAKFWASRLEWHPENKRYEINDIIGPDEYKEHVNNNAFTNYMAYFNLMLAIRYYEKLAEENQALLDKVGKPLSLTAAYTTWREKAAHLFLPEPRKEDRVIPQDDTYLQLKEIDLAKYKNQEKVRTIYRDYNSEQINLFQVTKQADTLLLFYLLEQTFLADDPRIAAEVKKANFHYYEPKTLHDSSLSLVTHAILANDIGERSLAYSLFQKALKIDLGPLMTTSDEGIHAASIGGIWKAAVFGFAGIRLKNGMLQITPKMPEQWKRMKLSIYWQGHPVVLSITHDQLLVTVEDGGTVKFETKAVIYECTRSMQIPLV